MRFISLYLFRFVDDNYQFKYLNILNRKDKDEMCMERLKKMSLVNKLGCDFSLLEVIPIEKYEGR